MLLMSKRKLSPEAIKALTFAALAEVMCLGAGIAAWQFTGRIIWLVIGIVASLGFSLPAVIRLIRDSKGQ